MQNFRRLIFSAVLLTLTAASVHAQIDTRWRIHDLDRPVPPVITPGTSSTQDTPGKPPSDAIVLFDGSNLSQWLAANNGPAKWKVENGYAEVVAKTGYIHTKQSFGDCQLHVEFSEPVPPHGESQDRGNSGVFLMGQYEIQVLDSYDNKTYADGQASAVYGQYPPLVNPARPPGQWQAYDIVFHGPRFDSSGKLLHPARITVFFNGVLVQDNVEPSGPTEHGERPPYKPSPEKAPLALQDHGEPVRYRNIWIRHL
jgi:Domain of Unknown Function (DUF1080)